MLEKMHVLHGGDQVRRTPEEMVDQLGRAIDALVFLEYSLANDADVATILHAAARGLKARQGSYEVLARVHEARLSARRHAMGKRHKGRAVHSALSFTQ